MNRLLSAWRGVLLVVGLALLSAKARAAEEVSVDMSRLNDGTYARVDGLGLHERLVLRLVQEGFAVVDSRGHLTVTLFGEGEALRIVVRRRDGAELQREVPMGATPSGELQLEVIQKVVTLARRLGGATTSPREAVPTAPGEPPARSPSEPSVVGSVAPEGASVDDEHVELGVGVGAMVRSGGADVVPRLGARIPVTSAFGLTIDAAITPTGERSLDIVEWQILGGIGYRILLAEPVPLDLGVSVGARFHHYHLPEADSRGAAADFSAALPVSLSWFVVRPFALQLRAELGIASRERQHTAFGDLLWHRGVVRGVFGGGCAVRF